MLEHGPDGWVSPIVGHFLWEDLDLEVIVAAFQHMKSALPRSEKTLQPTRSCAKGLRDSWKDVAVPDVR